MSRLLLVDVWQEDNYSVVVAGPIAHRTGILIGLCLPVFRNLFLALSAFILFSPVLVPLSSPSPEI